MSGLADQIEQKRAELANLEQQAKTATCVELGRHTWKQMGGVNCGCDPDIGWCSLPVYECSVCGACDYGENDEAAQMKSECQATGCEVIGRTTDGVNVLAPATKSAKFTPEDVRAALTAIKDHSHE